MYLRLFIGEYRCIRYMYMRQPHSQNSCWLLDYSLKTHAAEFIAFQQILSGIRHMVPLIYLTYQTHTLIACMNNRLCQAIRTEGY